MRADIFPDLKRVVIIVLELNPLGLFRQLNQLFNQWDYSSLLTPVKTTVKATVKAIAKATVKATVMNNEPGIQLR